MAYVQLQSKVRVVHISNIYHIFYVGNSGNNLIMLTHMLWAASVLNSTLILPSFMNSILSEFDLSVLHEFYCLIFTPSPVKILADHTPQTVVKLLSTTTPDASLGHRIYEIDSYTSFYAFLLYTDDAVRPLLPKYDDNLLGVLSRHFLRVSCALWSSPSQDIVASSAYIINQYLNSNFMYTTVHKRGLDGRCSKFLSSSLKISDYNTAEMPMKNKEWSADLRKKHPLCEMSGSFVTEVVSMHQRQNNQLFVSFDGRGDVSTLKALGAVFSSVLDSAPEFSHVQRKFVDMHMALHGDFFILNPRSTFSWQILLIRLCLGLESVPTSINSDFYLQDKKEYKTMHRDKLWVSYSSIVQAAKDLRKILDITDEYRES